MQLVDGCPCGQQHVMSADVKDAFDRVTAGLADTVLVKVRGAGCYRVPRIYIACHRFTGADLPGLAERYGFEQSGPA